jgi:hypothetical protein
LLLKAQGANSNEWRVKTVTDSVQYKKLMECMIVRNEWNGKILHQIDREVLRTVRKQTNGRMLMFTTRLIHRWQPTAKRLQ